MGIEKQCKFACLILRFTCKFYHHPESNWRDQTICPRTRTKKTTRIWKDYPLGSCLNFMTSCAEGQLHLGCERFVDTGIDKMHKRVEESGSKSWLTWRDCLGRWTWMFTNLKIPNATSSSRTGYFEMPSRSVLEGKNWTHIIYSIMGLQSRQE